MFKKYSKSVLLSLLALSVAACEVPAESLRLAQNDDGGLIPDYGVCSTIAVIGLTMHVSDEQGAPVSGAEVQARLQSSNAVSDDGFFEMSAGQYIGLAESPGTYSLTVTRNGFDDYKHPVPITIEMDDDGCHVKPVSVSIVLSSGSLTPGI